jgi:hypothetical protein
MDRLAALEERTARVQHEVTPNSGSSLRDAVTRIEQQLADHMRLPHDPR